MNLFFTLIFLMLSTREKIGIGNLTQKPEKYINKEVLVQGKIVDVCQDSGCWVLIEENKNKILAKSIDHKITFPKDSKGKIVEVRGILRGKIKSCCDIKEQEKEGHKCPTPEYFIEIKQAKIIE
ncbi:MAG: DUF4920 domain-containing protein [candidate division WOR-3 bacterium]